MNKKMRAAFSRLFADLIKADTVIDADEMSRLKHLKQKYHISDVDNAAANTLSFADALTTIALSNNRLREDIVNDAALLALSDGYCARQEALIIFAVKAMCGAASEVKAFSMPSAEFNIANSSILFIENDFDIRANSQIASNYRLIFKELQLAGFDFIYIPSIIEHYRNSSPELFENVAAFLAPALNPKRRRKIADDLLSTTTASFCRNILYNKFGIRYLRSTPPSFLIKISDSYVGDTLYANFIALKCEHDIVAQVRRIADTVNELINSEVHVVKMIEESGDRFVYTGFYKQLLDIFFVQTKQPNQLVITLDSGDLYFKQADYRLPDLHRKEKAFYILLLMGNADFSMPQSISQLPEYNARMQLIQRRYAQIYAALGGEEAKAPQIIQPEIRRPIVSNIKRSIAMLDSVALNASQYTVNRQKGDLLTVDVDMNYLFIREDGAEVPLLSSKFFKKIETI